MTRPTPLPIPPDPEPFEVVEVTYGIHAVRLRATGEQLGTIVRRIRGTAASARPDIEWLARDAEGATIRPHPAHAASFDRHSTLRWAAVAVWAASEQAVTR